MKRHLNYFLLLVALVIFAGCATGRTVTYNATINSVERPEDAKDRYGEYTVTETDTSYIYEDELIRAGFVTGGGSVFTTIENKTDHSIQIRLEQGAFVRPSGNSDRILLGEMSYMNRNQEVQPITVPSGASSTATLIPQSSVSMGQYGPSVSAMFTPTSVGGVGRNKTTVDGVRENIGKTFSLLLPIQIQDTVNEYTFNFEVTGAKVAAGRESSSTIVGDYPTGN